MSAVDWVLLYLIFINALEIILFVADKWKAKREQPRIQDKTLLLVAALGGAIGGMCASHLLQHMAWERKYSVGLPLLAAVHVLILYLYLVI